MAILKHASFQILSAAMAGQTETTLRTAHKAHFDYEPEPGYLYVRSRAISSRINENFDGFPAEEIKKAYATFIGKPVFVNHANENHRRMRGVIIDAALHEDVNPDGTPDTWVEVLMMVDAIKFPKLAQAILAGHVERTSMGCDVEYSVCTFCNNKAYTPQQYCAHIPRLKGQRIQRRTASGTTESVLVSEMCYGIGFFENSLLVEEPADPTAYFLGVDARGLGVTASYESDHALSEQYLKSGNPTSQDVDRLLDHYREMHGKDPSQAQIDKLRKKVKDEKRAPDGKWTAKTAGVVIDSSWTEADTDKLLQGMMEFDQMNERFAELTKQSDEAAPPVRIPNGTNIEVGDWIGLVVEQSGSKVYLTTGPGSVGTVDRSQIEKVDGHWKVVASNQSRGSYRSFGGKRIAALRTHAIGKVVAPAEVDTLRESTCPICGEDAFNGTECPVCMYVKPPDMYMDPDPAVAQETDLRGGENPENEQTPVGQDLTAGDLSCPQCGDTFPDAAAAPMGQDDQTAAPGTPKPTQKVDTQIPPPDSAPGAQMGDAPAAPPATGPVAEVPAPATGGDDPKAKPPAGEFLPKPGTDNDPTVDKKEHDDKGDSTPGDEKNPAKKEDPAKPDDKADPTKPDPTKKADPTDPADPNIDVPKVSEGDVCPTCGKGTLTKQEATAFDEVVGDTPLPKDMEGKDPFNPEDGDKDDDDKTSDSEGDKDDKSDDDDEDDKKKKGVAPWQKDSSTHEGVRVMSNGHQRSSSMTTPRSALRVVAEQQTHIKRLEAQAASQSRRLASQDAQIAWLKRAVDVIGEATGLKRQADAADPAQPVPSPGSQAAPSTTEQAMQPDGMDKVDTIGASPVNSVAADATDTVDSIGGIKADTPYNVSQDVTAPVSGTEGRQPLEDVRTLPEIQFGNPLKSDTAFPLQGEFEQKATVASTGRTFAALRLAKLQQELGLADRGTDELVLAASIDNNQEYSDRYIADQIETLARVKTARVQDQQPQRQARRLVPRSAGRTDDRTVPSMAGLAPIVGSTSGRDDDAFAFAD